MGSGEFRLLTLGRLALVDPSGVEDASLGSRRRKLALLALLATARRPVSRDALVELFWGEQSEERARHSLSDALSHLRRALGPGSITARRAEVALAEDAPLAVDVLALAAAADAGRWDEVVALYAGPFLDAVHVAGSPRWEQWVDQQRARVETAFQSACRAECARLATAGEWEACAALAARWLERAPLSAAAAVRRLTALAADGTPEGGRRALDAYDRLARLLRAEYGAAPDATVVAVAREIDARFTPPPIEPPVDQAPEPPVEAPVEPPVGSPAEPSPLVPGDHAVVIAPPGRHQRARRVLGAAAALVVIAASVVVLRPRERAASAPAASAEGPRDRVLVADFESAGLHHPVALLVSEAVRIGLGESPTMRVVDPSVAREALARMRRPGTTRIDSAVAHEVAQREGLEAVVTGAVQATPGGMVLSASLASAGGAPIATARAIAADSSELLAAADALVRQLRRGLGESGRALHATPELAAVTTRSRRALELYSQAEHATRRDGDRERAIALLEEAIRLDTTFAMAYRRLGVLLNGDPEVRDRMTDMLTRAVRHADRLSPRERHLTLGAYHLLVTADYARAAGAYRELLALRPDDGAAWHSLGMVYGYSGDRRRAADAYARAVAADPRSAATWVNLCDSRWEAGDSAGAWRAVEGMARALPGHPSVFRETALLAAATGDFVRAEQELRALLASTASNRRMQAIAHNLLSAVHWSAGRVDEGDAERREAAAIDRRRGAHAVALRRELGLAAAAAWLRGDTVETRRRTAAALARRPLDSLALLDRPYLDLATALALGGETARARRVLAEYERLVPEPIRRQDASSHGVARATIALVERRFGDAIAVLRRVPGPLCAVCGLPELAVAYEAVGLPDSARAVYARYLGTPTLWRLEETDGFHRHRATARLAALDRRD